MVRTRNNAKPLPPQEDLHSLLRYEPETGNLYWKERDLDLFSDKDKGRSWNTKNAGKEALATYDTHGYKFGTLRGKRNIRAHRIVWAMHNQGPFDLIDHINGIRHDNRLANLRVVDDAINHKNQKLYENNKSGAPGVCWNKRAKKWIAEIQSNGIKHHIGCFESIEDAIAARKKEEIRFGFHKNHGRIFNKEN